MIIKKKFIILCLVTLLLILILSNIVTVYKFFDSLLAPFHGSNVSDYGVSLDYPSGNLNTGLVSDSSETPMSDQAPAIYENSGCKGQAKSIKIEGVTFPIRSSFLTPKSTESDWGGLYYCWLDLERNIDHKIIDSTDLILSSDKIEFTHTVPGSDGVILSKVKNGYQISISVKLTGSVLAEQNAKIVKAMVVTISSKPTKVYNAIFDSFTSGKTHGIKKKKYKKIGDCKIKLKIKDGVVSYLIMKAT
jgi:hypothetical protein